MSGLSRRTPSPFADTQRSHHWSTSSSIRPLVSRQRAATPNLSIISGKADETSPEQSIREKLNARETKKDVHLFSVPSSPTLLHPSDYGDPDEVRDFSSVKPLQFRHSKALLPLPKFKRVVAPLEPVHRVLDSSKHLNSWPASQRPILSSSLAQYRPALPDESEGAHAPSSVSLSHIRQFIDDELRLVRRDDTGAALSVYSEAFAMLTNEFQSFGPLLTEIRLAYETRLAELDETCQAFMLGDEGVRQEKEKFLELQSVTIAAFEKEKRAVDGLRVRAMDSEEAMAKAEGNFESRLDVLREEVNELNNQLLMEKTVRIEHEDNLHTALRLMHEAREAASIATTRLEDVETSLTADNERLRRELSVSKRDYETLAIRSEEAHAVAEKRYQELLNTCVDDAKLSAIRLSLEKMGRNNVVLSKRNQWLQEQYDQYIKPYKNSKAVEVPLEGAEPDEANILN
jgi:hypothetical protein